MAGSQHHPFPPVLPSFSQTFPDRSRTRGQSFSTLQRTERERSYSGATLSAFNGPVQEGSRGALMLPPLRGAGALPASVPPGVHPSIENRQYSQSVPATRTTSPTQVGRKRSHEMATRHESSADEGPRREPALQSQVAWELTSEHDRHKERSKLRASRAQLANVDERDLTDAEDDDDESRTTRHTIIRVKVEDRDEPTTRTTEISGAISQSYRSRNSSSPSAASMRRMSTSTTSTSLTPYDAPSPLRVPSESSGDTAPTNAMSSPLNLSTLSSAALSPTIQKKRRVTVSGASVPSSTRSIYGQMSSVVSPISPAVIGFSVPKTPEAVDQLRSALSFKHQQKALIEARRFSHSVGATPEPSTVIPAFSNKAKRGRPSKRSESQVSATAASPISPQGSSDFAGTTASFTSFSTNMGTNSRTSSPASTCHMEHERRLINPTISSSTMEAALDVEMELESDMTPLYMRRRPQGESGSTSQSEGTTRDAPSAQHEHHPRRGRSNPKLTLRTSVNHWPVTEHNPSHQHWPPSTDTSENENSSLRSAPPTLTPNHPQFSDIGRSGGTSPGPSLSSQSGGAEQCSRLGVVQTRPMPLIQHQSEPHLHVTRPQVAIHSDTNGLRKQTRAPEPLTLSRTSSFHSHASSENVFAIERPASTIQLERRYAALQSQGQQTLAAPTAPTFAPSSLQPPTQPPRYAALDASSSPTLSAEIASGSDDLISKTAFMSLFEGVYDSIKDARRIRTWIEDQQKQPVPASPREDDTSGYIREQDVARIVEEKVQTVREEARHEINLLTGRIHELEVRLKASERGGGSRDLLAVENGPGADDVLSKTLNTLPIDEDGKTPKRRSPTMLMDFDRDKTPAPADRHAGTKMIPSSSSKYSGAHS